MRKLEVSSLSARKLVAQNILSRASSSPPKKVEVSSLTSTSLAEGRAGLFACRLCI